MVTFSKSPKVTDADFRDRAETILHNLALERVGPWRRFWRRWEISDEPLRCDAARLLREAGVHIKRPPNTQLVDTT